MIDRSIAVAALAVVTAAVLAACAGPTPSPAPTATASPAPSGTPVVVRPGEPPIVRLIGADGRAIAGALGTFSWAGLTSDAPWLPGAPVQVRAGEPIRFDAPAGLPAVDSWTSRLAIAETRGRELARTGEGSAGDPVEVSLPAGDGAWELAITIRFVGGDSATWFWSLSRAP